MVAGRDERVLSEVEELPHSAHEPLDIDELVVGCRALAQDFFQNERRRVFLRSHSITVCQVWQDFGLRFGSLDAMFML